MLKQEPFVIEKWHKNVAADKLIKKKMHLPMIKMAGLSAQDTKIVFDLGCGSGELIKNAIEVSPHSTYIGLDFNKDVLDFARKNLRKANITVKGPVTTFKACKKYIHELRSKKKKCILFHKDFLFDKEISLFADVVFLLFPQYGYSDIFKEKISHLPVATQLELIHKVSQVEFSLSLEQGIKMLKKGGKFIEGNYTGRTVKQIKEIHNAFARFPFADPTACSIFKDNKLGKVIEKGRSSDWLKKNIDNLTFGVLVTDRITRETRVLIDQINMNYFVFTQIQKGDFILNENNEIFVNNGRFGYLPLSAGFD